VKLLSRYACKPEKLVPNLRADVLTFVSCPQGFVKEIIQEGDGPLAKGDVKVHYTGTLLDGTVFDSSRPKNRPFTFALGQGEVIRGWDEGVATMKVGERAQLVLSSDFGYGPQGAGDDIPPNATLVFDVEVLAALE
jgi:peptidylprolyl isomerase